MEKQNCYYVSGSKMSDLNNECLETIFSFLPIADIKSAEKG